MEVVVDGNEPAGCAEAAGRLVGKPSFTLAPADTFEAVKLKPAEGAEGAEDVADVVSDGAPKENPDPAEVVVEGVALNENPGKAVAGAVVLLKLTELAGAAMLASPTAGAVAVVVVGKVKLTFFGVVLMPSLG